MFHGQRIVGCYSWYFSLYWLIACVFFSFAARGATYRAEIFHHMAGHRVRRRDRLTGDPPGGRRRPPAQDRSDALHLELHRSRRDDHHPPSLGDRRPLRTRWRGITSHRVHGTSRCRRHGLPDRTGWQTSRSSRPAPASGKGSGRLGGRHAVRPRTAARFRAAPPPREPGSLAGRRRCTPHGVALGGRGAAGNHPAEPGRARAQRAP